jgi:hypothetical protein
MSNTLTARDILSTTYLLGGMASVHFTEIGPKKSKKLQKATDTWCMGLLPVPA